MLELGLPLDTLTVRTPSGGLHLYYRGPSVACSAGKLGDGLDVRGHHGFVLAPGSVVNGGHYTILHDAPVQEIDPAFHALFDQPSERAEQLVEVELDDPTAIEHARNWLEQQPGAVEHDGGDSFTYRTACRLKDFGLSELVAGDLLLNGWNERCTPRPWPVEMPPCQGRQRVRVRDVGARFAKPSASIRRRRHTPPSRRPRAASGSIVMTTGAVRSEWLIHELLPTTGVCILTAPSNAGKTFVALDLAEALALQRPFFGMIPEFAGATCLLVGEAYGSIKMRLQALRKGIPVAATYVGGLAARGVWEGLKNDLKGQSGKPAGAIRPARPPDHSRHAIVIRDLGKRR